MFLLLFHYFPFYFRKHCFNSSGIAILSDIILFYSSVFQFGKHWFDSLASVFGLIMLSIIMLTSPCNIDPLNPTFIYSKIGVYRGMHYFIIFALKHRLWVLVRTASIYFSSKNKKNKMIFY